MRRSAGWLPLSAVIVWVVLAARYLQRLGGKSLDDFFITYRYSWNLVHGNGFVFNPGERTFGLTEPAMGLLVALVHWVSRIPIPWVGSLISALSLVGLAALLLRRGERNGFLLESLLGGTLLVGSSFLWGTHGASASLVLLLLLLAAALGHERPLIAGILAGLAVWFRPDAVVGVGILGLLLWLERRRLPWKYGVAGAFVIALGATGAWLYFGDVLPKTLEAKKFFATWGKIKGGHRFWPSAAPAMRGHFGIVWLLTVGMGIAGQWLLFVRGDRVTRLLSLFAISLAIAYPLLGVPYTGWYLVTMGVALFYGLAFLVSAAVEGVTGQITRGRWAGWVQLLLLIAVLYPVVRPMIEQSSRWYKRKAVSLHYDGYRQAGEWLKENAAPGARVSYVEVGTVAYYSQIHVEDLMGLVTPRVLPWVEKGDLRGAFLDAPTEYLILRPRLTGFMGQVTKAPWFPRHYREVVRFLPETDTWVAIYQRRRGAGSLPQGQPPKERRPPRFRDASKKVDQ